MHAVSHRLAKGNAVILDMRRRQHDVHVSLISVIRLKIIVMPWLRRREVYLHLKGSFNLVTGRNVDILVEVENGLFPVSVGRGGRGTEADGSVTVRELAIPVNDQCMHHVLASCLNQEVRAE